MGTLANFLLQNYRIVFLFKKKKKRNPCVGNIWNNRQLARTHNICISRKKKLTFNLHSVFRYAHYVVPNLTKTEIKQQQNINEEDGK